MIPFKLFFEEYITRRRSDGDFQRPYGTTFDKSTDQWKSTDNSKVEYEKKRHENINKFRMSTHHDKMSDNIRQDKNDLLGEIMRYHGFSLKDGLNGLPKDGSLVYRGHKSPDPFEKGEDAKALDNSVYFAANPEYAYRVYSVSNNPSSSQIGQRGFSNLQASTQKPQGLQRFELGFFTVATPTNPDQILWYPNFGYEDKKQGQTRSEVKLGEDFECVEPKGSFSKIRTYLLYRKYMISFGRLKKVHPKTYDEVMSSYVIDSVHRTRAI